MVKRPAAVGAFEFVVLSTLRVAQLLRGCVPIIDPGDHRPAVTAQLEVAGGYVVDTFYARPNDASATKADPSGEVPHVRA